MRASNANGERPMPEMLTLREIAELDNVCAAATPNWTTELGYVGSLRKNFLVRKGHDGVRFGNCDTDEHDMEFAARSRTALPAALATIKTLRSALAEIWISVPALYAPDARHAAALNAAAPLLAALDGIEPAGPD